MREDHRQSDPIVTVEPVAIPGTGRRVVVNVGRFDLPSISLGGRIVHSKQPVAVDARVESLEDQHQQRQHHRRGIFADRREQIIETVPIVLDAGGPEPTGSCATSSGKHHAGDHDGQSKGNASIRILGLGGERAKPSWRDVMKSDLRPSWYRESG